MTHVKIGEIYVYSVALTEININKNCPVLIISAPNSTGNISAIVGVSSAHSDADEPWQVAVTEQDLEDAILQDEIVFPLAQQILVAPQFLQTRLGHLTQQKLSEILKKIALRQTEIYYHAIHEPAQQKTFAAGESPISYAGRVFDEKEMVNLVDSSLDFWLTAGPYTEKFERAFSKKLGVRYCALVNSGSSANLIAFMALTSPKLGDRRIRKGDEIITLAAGFPTTINPILQFGAIPVFVDVTLPTYNIDVTTLENARSEKTKAIMIAHTLGNPFNVEAVKAFCDKYNLWLIEDNCDALGSLYQEQWTGTFGDIATSSFYPPHHITMGEGGAVYTNNSRLKVALESFRDWGRDCYCASGKDNTCKKRFGWELGTLPKGYDHKYIYSHLGYNLKATDLQAAIGCAQLDKLDSFVKSRRQNWQTLYDGLKEFEDVLILPEPTPHSKPSWFGFILTVRDLKRFSRNELVQHLESCQIQTRMLFAGNYVRHPVLTERSKTDYRVVGPLKNTDRVMNDSFWIGVYPGMNDAKLQYMLEKIQRFCR